MGWVWDLRQAWKDSTALCKILNSEIIRDPNRISQDPGQNPVQSLLILVKILWDIRQDSELLNVRLVNPAYEIVINSGRSYSIIDKMI